MRLHLIALIYDHTRAPVALRERLAFSDETLPNGLTALAPHVHEGLILSTCNRVEVYAVADEAGGVAPLQRAIADVHTVPPQVVAEAGIALQQREAMRHLFRVASGLEAMVLGEPQILGQVRHALEQAHAAHAAGPVISRLGTEALRVGKRARSETAIARNRLSIPHAAVDLAASRLGGLAGRRAVVAGAGEMATLTAKLLRDADAAEIVVASRGAERGRALAERVGGRFVPLAALPAALPTADVLFTAVAGRTPLLDASTVAVALRDRARPLLALDLGVPRNIAPDVGQLATVRLFDVDHLRGTVADRHARYRDEVRRVEAMIEEASDAFLAWWAAREAAPTIAALRRHGEAIRQAELDRALRKLGHLSPRDRNVVAALSVGLVNKLLHEPITGLKTASDQRAATRLIEELFHLEHTADAMPSPGERDDDSRSKCP